MTKEIFTYSMFEETREVLIKKVNNNLSENDKNLLLSFAFGKPEWREYDFSSFPGIEWKLMNIRFLKKHNRKKFEQQIILLEDAL